MSAFSKALTALSPAMLIAGSLFATGALAQERCSGTFCDLFYHGAAPAPAAPQSTAPTPVTVPSTGGILNFFRSAPSGPTAQGGAPAPSNSFVKVEGGGLIGDKSQRCSGTICDFYYGGPPPAQPAGPAATAVAQPAPGARQVYPRQAAVAQPASGARPVYPRQVAVARPPESPEMVSLRQADERRRLAEAANQAAKAKCRNANDPWHCYR